MSKREVLVTPWGEMMDYLACFSIEAGASQKKKEMSKYDMFFSIM